MTNTESGGELLQRLGTDARLWAKEIKAKFGDNVIDEDTFIGWFANAIMAGYDLGRQHSRRDRDDGKGEFDNYLDS